MFKITALDKNTPVYIITIAALKILGLLAAYFVLSDCPDIQNYQYCGIVQWID